MRQSRFYHWLYPIGIAMVLFLAALSVVCAKVTDRHPPLANPVRATPAIPLFTALKTPA